MTTYKDDLHIKMFSFLSRLQLMFWVSPHFNILCMLQTFGKTVLARLHKSTVIHPNLFIHDNVPTALFYKNIGFIFIKDCNENFYYFLGLCTLKSVIRKRLIFSYFVVKSHSANKS